MLNFADILPTSGLYRGFLVAITFLFFLAIATKAVAVLVLYLYCRGVRSGYVPHWVFHLDGIRRYMATEPLEDMRGPGWIVASPCCWGIPEPKL
jgi:hypothetical protein